VVVGQVDADAFNTSNQPREKPKTITSRCRTEIYAYIYQHS